MRRSSRTEFGDAPFFDGEVEPCINGLTAVLGAYYGRDVTGIVARLMHFFATVRADQLLEGGWQAAFGGMRQPEPQTV